MRHHDRDASVCVRQRRDAEGRAARVCGIRRRRRCDRDSHSGTQRARSSRRHAAAAADGKLARPSPCAMAIGRNEPAMPSSTTDGELRISTIVKRASYCSLRLRHEARPQLRAGNEALQRREHLAAVAEAEREAVVAREEAHELVAHGLVEQNGFRPALARAEHVAVGEAAAGDDALELLRASGGRRAGRSCARRALRSRRARATRRFPPDCSRPARAARPPRAARPCAM